MYFARPKLKVEEEKDFKFSFVEVNGLKLRVMELDQA